MPLAAIPTIFHKLIMLNPPNSADLAGQSSPRKFHLALGVADLERTIADYSQRLGQEPDLVIPGEYALWRTAALNVSVRKTGDDATGTLRHLGWETDAAETFSSETDCNGIVWEQFTAAQQAQEIQALWPNVVYRP